MKIKVYLTGITAIAAAGLVLALSLFALPELAVSQDVQPLSITMEGYDYPYPVTYLPLTIEGQDLRMAYMDVPPEGPGSRLDAHGWRNIPGARPISAARARP